MQNMYKLAQSKTGDQKQRSDVYHKVIGDVKNRLRRMDRRRPPVEVKSMATEASCPFSRHSAENMAVCHNKNVKKITQVRMCLSGMYDDIEHAIHTCV